jgi:hypothetical protein
MVDMELHQLWLSICQDDLVRHWDFLFRDHLHRAFFVDLLCCGGRGSRRWWHGNRGCSSISSIIDVLFFTLIIFILSHAVQSSLPSDVH